MSETEDYDKSSIPTAHKASHQDGGSDEISVASLSGELADNQKSTWAKVSGKPTIFAPEAHKTSHQDGGSDEISVGSLSGELADNQKPKDHTHQAAGAGGQLNHALALTGLLIDDHMQYPLLIGRTGGQTLYGGPGSGDDLILESTSHATDGFILLGSLSDNTNVGIGMANPLAKLHIYNTATTNVWIDTALNGVSNLAFLDGTTAYWTISHRGTFDAPNRRLAFYNGAAEIFTLSPSSRVGILSVNPASTLDVQGTIKVWDNGGATFLFGTSHSLRYTVGAAGAVPPGTDLGYVNLEAVNYPISAWSHLILQGRTQMTLGSGFGFVGIGAVTDPRGMLDVAGSILSTDFIRAEGYASPPATGAGLEMGYTGGIGYLTSYNRASSVGTPLVLRGSTTSFHVGTGLGTTAITITDALISLHLLTQTGTNFTIGTGAPGADYVLTFDGETNDGLLYWMEDEDHFQFDDDVFIKGDLVSNTYNYGADAGTTDTYAITLDPAPAAYTTGMMVVWKANTANTGACTLNVNSLGVKSLKIKGGSADPEDNFIRAGGMCICVYDGTNFQLIGADQEP